MFLLLSFFKSVFVLSFFIASKQDPNKCLALSVNFEQDISDFMVTDRFYTPNFWIQDFHTLVRTRKNVTY